MNIFKVLASGKKSFQEETASAIIAWFMNPQMEHGLGYTFLVKFLEELSASTNSKEISDLANKMAPRLRSEEENQMKFACRLEHNVDMAFIDIVLKIEDWIIAIENKIYSNSVSKGQLVREYTGLKQNIKDEKIGMIYLVPIEENSDMLDPKTESVFNELNVQTGDIKAVVTWQKNEIDDIPSISTIISNILEEESKGLIDPLAEYTRHTLKALLSFISNDFSGYEFEHDNQNKSGANPLTEKRLSTNEVLMTNKGYVGVQGGIRGLLKMEKSKLSIYKFQYTTQNMLYKQNWMEIEVFQKIANWLLGNGTPKIDWSGNFSLIATFPYS